jgi:3-hydroxy-9,10-secoandrosta-1,3,5(10)-triene-9,17-dione monooxygenase
MSKRSELPLRTEASGQAGSPHPKRTAIPAPEPSLTPKEIVARAAALRPLLRAQQDENDERGT